MSKNYNLIKMYYDAKIWSIERVKKTVGLATGITTEEFYDITGETYNK